MSLKLKGAILCLIAWYVKLSDKLTKKT